MHNSNIPPAWDYNPSSRKQRNHLVITAVAGLCIALYLGLYQLHIFSTVWDPFFINGSKEVLHSSVAKSLPVPDAFLGAFAYLMDAAGAFIGGEHRWKTSPWMVLFYGMVVGPLGMISIVLVIVQPVFLHAWCTLCLCSAAISISMISPATDEVLATLQYLQRVKRHGYPVWKAIWGDEAIRSKVQ